jgi:RHS repeat-associated protein
MEFIYGVLGVEGFTLLDRTYRYRKNILGDIIGIIDEDNNEIVRYVYDAYGNHKVYLLSSDGYIECDYDLDYTDNSILDTYRTISKENPFRYSGYYFDIENNMYYLNSRYYDSNVGRFISPDSLEYLEPNSINGLNLYCYCMNNPINKVDPSGTSWKSFWSKIKVKISKTIGFVANFGEESVESFNYYYFFETETGFGYSKDFDNGKMFNFYVSIPEIESLFDLRKVSFGFDLNINGYGVGIGFGAEKSIALHFNSYSLDIYQDALKRTGVKMSSRDVDGVYSYSKFEINGLEIAGAILFVKYVLPYFVSLLRDKLGNLIFG